MTVLYLAQQKRSIPSHPGSQHSNSDISFWSSVSSLIIAVRCYLFSLILNFFCCFTYLWCAVIDFLTKAGLPSFTLQLQQKEITSHASWFLRKIKENSSFGYSLVLLSNSDLKYSCTSAMQVSETPLTSALKLMKS